MATRAELFANSYDARKRLGERWAYTLENVKDEQDRLAASESLLTSERANLTNLEQVFATKPTQDGLATEILKASTVGQVNIERAAAAAASQGKASALPPASFVNFVSGFEGKGSIKAAELYRPILTEAGRLLAVPGKAGMSSEQAKATLDYLRRIGIGEGEIANLSSAAGKVKDRPPAASGPGKQTEEQKAQVAGQKTALEALYFGSPQGYAGGFEAEAIANRRKATPGVEGTSFSTEEDAFRAYLGMLEDGTASSDELAALTNQEDPAQAAADFKLAERLYREAKATKAFTNADRKYFEPAWIDQAKRVTELQNEISSTKQSYGGRSPAQEAAYRELKARGLDPDDPHVALFGTKNYDYAKGADAIYADTVGQKKELIPATYTQKKVAAFVEQLRNSGNEWKTKDLERQLGKTLSGKELTDAIAFALAYDRVKDEGEKPVTQSDLQVTEEKRKAVLARETDARQKQLREDAASAELAKKNIETRLGSELRMKDNGEDPEAQRESARKAYARFRAQGLSPEEAKAKSMSLVPGNQEMEASPEKALFQSRVQRGIQDIPIKPTPEVLAGPDSGVPPTPGTLSGRIVRDGPDVISDPPVTETAPPRPKRNRQIEMPTPYVPLSKRKRPSATADYPESPSDYAESDAEYAPVDAPAEAPVNPVKKWNPNTGRME